jgi:hypothetical protein
LIPGSIGRGVRQCSQSKTDGISRIVGYDFDVTPEDYHAGHDAMDKASRNTGRNGGVGKIQPVVTVSDVQKATVGVCRSQVGESSLGNGHVGGTLTAVLHVDPGRVPHNAEFRGSVSRINDTDYN